MTNKFHDQLDAFEARVRAEQEEIKLAQFAKQVMQEEEANIEADKAKEEKPLCICLKYIGDNGYCPVHGDPFKDPFGEDGSDTSMASQLNDAGFGSGGIL